MKRAQNGAGILEVVVNLLRASKRPFNEDLREAVGLEIQGERREQVILRTGMEHVLAAAQQWPACRRQS